MAYKIPFPGTANLKETENTVIAYQLGQTSNMVNIEGRNAEFDDGTKMNVNVVEFEPVDTRPEIRKKLEFVEKTNVDFAAMAAAGMSQLGGAGKEFTIFVSNIPETIYIFFRMR